MSTPRSHFDAVIVGAGVVGVASALWAQMRGQSVALIDPAPVGSGASSGNACTLATYACLPVNDPSVFANLPYYLFSNDSPLALSWGHALRHPIWMMKFLANCRATKSRQIAQELAALLAHADAGLNPLIEAAAAEDLIIANGQLTVWRSATAADADRAGLKFRRDQGIPFEELSGAEAHAMEPALAFQPARGVYYSLARHIRDPLLLTQRLHQKFTELGGQTIAKAVTELSDEGAQVRVHLGQDDVTAARVVLAAGAYSAQIKGGGAEHLPLQTERGYHLIYKDLGHYASRPVGWVEGGFYTAPMAQGLRLAGTVEIAALNAPQNPRRLDYIARKGAELWGDLPTPDATWIGCRPTLPDALPVIGPSPSSSKIIHAFGHQHLGLTLAGVTGRIVADLLEGRQPNLAIGGLSAARSFL